MFIHHMMLRQREPSSRQQIAQAGPSDPNPLDFEILFHACYFSFLFNMRLGRPAMQKENTTYY